MFFPRQSCNPCKTQLCGNPCPGWGLQSQPCLSGWNQTLSEPLSQSPVSRAFAGSCCRGTAGAIDTMLSVSSRSGESAVSSRSEECLLLKTMTLMLLGIFSPSVPFYGREVNPREKPKPCPSLGQAHPLSGWTLAYCPAVATVFCCLTCILQVAKPDAILVEKVPCDPRGILWFRGLRQSQTCSSRDTCMCIHLRI